MNEIIITTDIKKESGYIYFVQSDEQGNIIVARTKSGRRKNEEEK